jgi:hypothetical protein
MACSPPLKPASSSHAITPPPDDDSQPTPSHSLLEDPSQSQSASRNPEKLNPNDIASVSVIASLLQLIQDHQEDFRTASPWHQERIGPASFKLLREKLKSRGLAEYFEHKIRYLTMPARLKSDSNCR